MDVHSMHRDHAIHASCPSQGRSDSVRVCFMNFALSFLIVGESDVIKSILELKGVFPCADSALFIALTV